MTDSEGKATDLPAADATTPAEMETTPPVELAEPRRDPAPLTQTAPRKSNRFAPLLAGGVLAAGLGFALAQVVPGGWPLAATRAVEAQLAEQQAQIAALQAAQGSTPDTSALETRLAALETRAEPDIAALADGLADLSRRVQALEAAPAGSGPSPDALKALEAAMADLQARIDPASAAPAALDAAAEARLQEAEAAAARLKAEAEALAQDARRQAALTRLDLALDSGLPFADVLADLGPDVPAALADHAATGLPTLAGLRDSFPDVARAALEAALRADMGESWAERVGSFLRNQTGARSLTPREGTDPDAILSRAEAAVQTGDLATALQELAAMPEAAQPALADWRALAETRRQGEDAARALAARPSE